ncbi:hypothetical protein P0L94_05915 [Microbacter sp. GSS18]|nr:hypothetical protein P0L94_05915 [Microbacter sp. GSS18]
MTFDVASVLAVSALVVNLAGALFILETLLRRDEGAGRVWALGFLAAMLMSLSYVLWTQTHGTWWAIAVGNSALVAFVGCLWLGMLMFNGHPLLVPTIITAVATGATGIAVMVQGPGGGDWVAAEWMFVSIIGLAGAGAVECLRGELMESRSAWVLALASGVLALYYVSRTTAFATAGPDSTLFQAGFGAVPTSLITIAYVLVAVVVLSVLRATRAPMRGALRSAADGGDPDEIMVAEDFARSLGGLCGRAQRRGELVGVISVRIDDLEQISTAFGSESARAVGAAWRHGVRRHAPSSAFVGEDGPGGLVVGVLISSPADARRQAAVIYRGVFDDLGAVGHGVIPVLGVGVGLSDSAGYDADGLVEVAREAATRASLSIETSVLIGGEGAVSVREP